MKNNISEFNKQLINTKVDCKPYHITGYLNRVDVEKEEVQIRLNSGRHLAAYYSRVPNIESFLLDNLRNPVHVYGDIVFNMKDEPVSISRVNKILPVDESPIEMNKVRINEQDYYADPPLKFEVTFDTKTFYYGLEGEFIYYIYDETRTDLEKTLEAELEFLWNEYAEEQTDPLSLDALELQSKLRKRLKLHS